MITRQELHCHNCGKYVQFDIDESLDGTHTLHCPNCNHEHMRVVKNGIITDERWGRSASQININPATLTTSTTSSYSNYGGVSVYAYYAWMNTTATS